MYGTALLVRLVSSPLCSLETIVLTPSSKDGVEKIVAGCDDKTDPLYYIMFSPNDNNAGGGFYCVTGTCRSKNSAYWPYADRHGGPL